MATNKKIISLYNFLKKEGFNDEANLVKSTIIKVSIDELGTLPAETEAGGGVAALREDSRYTIDAFNDAVKNVVWDIPAKYWMERPQYIEGVSILAKAAGGIMTFFPTLTPVGLATIKGSAALDFAAAAARFARGEDFLALLDFLSGVTSVPAGALKSVFALMVSEEVIRIYAFALGAERAVPVAAMSARSVVATIPVLLDFLIGSLENLRAGADSLITGLGDDIKEDYTRRLKDQCNIQISTLKMQKQKIEEIQRERT